VTAQTDDRACLWCKRPFTARRGGSPKRFWKRARRGTKGRPGSPNHTGLTGPTVKLDSNKLTLLIPRAENGIGVSVLETG
jgi:hypothetical protein